jgi:hypothetical protein
MRNAPILILALTLIGCFRDGPVAGGSGMETTNGIAGTIRAGGGSEPAAGMTVTLYAREFDPSTGKGDSLPRAITDAAGNFAFPEAAPGLYSVLARSGGEALLTQDVPAVDGKRTVLAPKSLARNGAIRLPLNGIGGGLIYLPGTDRFLALPYGETHPEAVVLDSVPAGVYARLMYRDDLGDPDRNLLPRPVEVTPGDTLQLPSYLLWTASDTLKLNTTSAAADVPGDVADFPLLVRLTAADFDFLRADPVGQDVRFSDAQGHPLPYAIERWDAAMG